MRVLPLALVTIVLAATGRQAMAQPVFRCEVAGKATYQSEPCATGKASAVKIIGGPTAEDAAAAQKRAQRDQQAAAALSAPPFARAPATQNNLPGLRRAPADCPALATQRERAYAQRNGAMNAARRSEMGVRGGSREDQAIGQMNMDIGSLESTMRARGCSLS